MKTTTACIAALAAITAIGFTACGNKTTKTSDVVPEIVEEDNSVTVKSNSVSDTTLTIGGVTADYVEVSRIFQADTTGQFYLSVRAVLPVTNSAVTDSLFSAIASYYNQIADTATTVVPGGVVNPMEFAKAVDAMGVNFVKLATPFATDTVTFGYQMNADVRPVYAGDKFLTYSVYEDSYTGGAHGDVNAYFVSFDPASGAEYTFEKMFKADKLADVRAKLVEVIAADKGQTVDEYLKSLTDWMENGTVTVANFPVYNVGITAQGVVFSYPKYSIAAGFEGCPAYAIPLDELSSYLAL